MIQKNERRKYASDLSDSQWAIIEPLFISEYGNALRVDVLESAIREYKKLYQ